MKYSKGQSGNPKGRPPGAPTKRDELKKLLESRATELIEKVIQQALQGESTALRICMDRLIPRVKDEHISLDLPNAELDKVVSLLQIGANVITAVSNGELTPDTGHRVMSLIEAQRKNIETSELTERLTAIERTLKNRKE